ncbi:MAG TPA: prephenate dehydrogenase [Tepidisphaeraceae bacterium]|nr:prephenate dehydrogenase [Tepidisphaeraceae bacterium]
MTPKRLTILGIGLLGGSIGLAVKKLATPYHVIGYDHRRETLNAALACGALDEAFDQPQRAVKDADLVILCTPVGVFEKLLTQIAPALPDGCLVTDVGSTKRSIVQLAANTLPPTAHFVGSHPMAGSEKRGVEFARADLFQNALCLVTPTPTTNPAALTEIESFWRLLGMQIRQMTPEEHDRRLADISHLPHALAAAMVNIQPKDALALSGKGFLDTTRIAAGDAGLWRDILLDNQDNLITGIGRMQEELLQLKSLIVRRDSKSLLEWLDRAAAIRQQLKSAPPQ